MAFLFIPILLLIAIHDLRTHRIPNWMNLILFCISSIYVVSNLKVNPFAILQGATGAAVVLAILIMIGVFSRGGLGGGDIKMATSLAFASASRSWTVLFEAWINVGLIAGLMGVWIMISGKPRNQAIAFGPALGLGYLWVLV